MKVPSRAGDAPREVAEKPGECWLLAWFEGGRGWDRCRFLKDYRAGTGFGEAVPAIDVPFLIVLQHEPEKVRLAPDGLTIAGTAPLGDVVRTRQQFAYHEIRDDWKTPARRLAPISPVVALAMRGGFDVRRSEGTLTDPGLVTHWDPYVFVDGKDANAYEVKGILKYIDEVEIPDVAKVNRGAAGYAEAERLMSRPSPSPRRAPTTSCGT